MEEYLEVSRSFSERIVDLGRYYSKKVYWWLSPYTEKNGYPSEHIMSELLISWLKKKCELQKEYCCNYFKSIHWIVC